MQTLPLRDEVAQARIRAKRAEDAMNLSQQTGIALTAIAIVERQVRALDLDEVELPGDAIVESAAAAYPELAALRDIGPDPSTPPTRQLEQRRMQLRTIDQVLRPLAADFDDLSAEVHELQHQQFRMLQQPEYAELREELDARNDIRRRASIAMGRLKARRESLLPAEKAVELFLPQAEQELAAADDPMQRELARGRLLTLLQTLDTAARAVGQHMELPDTTLLMDPDCPVAVLSDAVRALSVLRDATHTEAAKLQEKIDHQQALADQATAWMLERTG